VAAISGRQTLLLGKRVEECSCQTGTATNHSTVVYQGIVMGTFD